MTLRKTKNFMPKEKRDVVFYCRNYFTDKLEIKAEDWVAAPKIAISEVGKIVDKINSSIEDINCGIYNFKIETIKNIVDEVFEVTYTLYRVARYKFQNTDKNVLELAQTVKDKLDTAVQDGTLKGYDFMC
jgi:hypothetical protein